MEQLPFFDAEGERARLFPVLSEKSKEGRTLSAFLATLGQVREFSNEALGAIGQPVGVRARLETFTEVTFPKSKNPKLRPDGLIVLSTGKRTWSALVEAKIAGEVLKTEQIEAYLSLAREVGVDSVITISNEFAASHSTNPVSVNKKLLRSVDLFHFSWFSILTYLNVLSEGGEVADNDHVFLLNELERFLIHPSAGLKRFTEMAPAWADVISKVRSDLPLTKSSEEVSDTVASWQAEVRDLCLFLTRKTGATVTPKLSRNLRNDTDAIFKKDVDLLVKQQKLCVSLNIPNAAAPLEIEADVSTRTIRFSAELTAPKDKQRQQSRLNWLLFQLPDDDGRATRLRSLWPGRAEPIESTLSEARDEAAIHSHLDRSILPHKFVLLDQITDGKRFAGRKTFITDLEDGALEFYETTLSRIKAWVPPAPKIRQAVEEDGDPPA